MDNPDFYDQIMNIIEDFGNERYLLCGDFNLVFCQHIDCYKEKKKCVSFSKIQKL
jgi:exonuclease III